jgi:hypothetical protein
MKMKQKHRALPTMTTCHLSINSSFRSAAGAPQIIAWHHAAKFALSRRTNAGTISTFAAAAPGKYKGQDLTLA